MVYLPASTKFKPNVGVIFQSRGSVMGKKGSRACSTIRKTWKSNCHGYHTSCTNSITRVLIHPLTTIKAKAWRNQQKSTYKIVGGSKIGNHSPAWRGRIRVQSVGKHAPIVGVWDRNWCFILIVQNVCYQNAFIIFSGPLCKMLIIFDKIIIFIKFKIVIPIIPIIPPPSPWPPGLSSFQEPQALLQTKNKQIQKYPLNHRFTTWPPLENRRRRDGETKNPILKKKKSPPDTTRVIKAMQQRFFFSKKTSPPSENKWHIWLFIDLIFSLFVLVLFMGKYIRIVYTMFVKYLPIKCLNLKEERKNHTSVLILWRTFDCGSFTL